MKKSQTILLIFTILVFISSQKDSRIQAKLDFAQYCLYHGYPTQTHIIHTKDGYNLKFFRLQGKGNKIQTRNKVVYLQHGLEDSSDTWVLNEETKAPGFILANKGYDVWLGNVRGNHYSCPTLSPRVKNFWDFSFDEMVKFDLPAAFEYISKETGKKIHYIGHSQGSLIMFAALSQRIPSIINLLASYSGIGPAAYLKHHDSLIFKVIGDTPFLRILKSFEVKELLYSGYSIRQGLSYITQYVPFIGDQLLYLLSQKNNTVNNLERVPIYMGHFPCGSSVKNFEHYKQLMNSDIFRKFDYGQKQNMKVYGTKEPPVYNLSNINFPTHLFVGNYDRLADLTDAKRLFNEIGSKQKTYTVLNFGHMTFVWGKDMSYVEQLLRIIQDSNDNVES